LCHICHLNDKYGECIAINCCVGSISHTLGRGIIYLHSTKIPPFIGNCALAAKLLMYGINRALAMRHIHVFITEF